MADLSDRFREPVGVSPCWLDNIFLPHPRYPRGPGRGRTLDYRKSSLQPSTPCPRYGHLRYTNFLGGYSLPLLRQQKKIDNYSLPALPIAQIYWRRNRYYSTRPFPFCCWLTSMYSSSGSVRRSESSASVSETSPSSSSSSPWPRPRLCLLTNPAKWFLTLKKGVEETDFNLKNESRMRAVQVYYN